MFAQWERGSVLSEKQLPKAGRSDKFYTEQRDFMLQQFRTQKCGAAWKWCGDRNGLVICQRRQPNLFEPRQENAFPGARERRTDV